MGSDVFETRFPNADPGIDVSVPFSKAGKLSFEALLDGASELTALAGQEEATGVLKVIGAIAGIAEPWSKDYDEEKDYVGAINGADAWAAANAAEHGNDPDFVKHIPDQFAGDPYGWTHCSMNLVRVRYYTISSWHADAFDAHGYNSSGHIIQTTKVTSVHEEQVFQPLVY